MFLKYQNILYHILFVQFIFKPWGFQQIYNHDELGKQQRFTTTLPKYETFPEATNKYDSSSNILKYYNIGLQECNTYLDNHRDELDKGVGVSPIFVDPAKIQSSGYKECRGNGLLYKVTKSIPWLFGPGISHSNLQNETSGYLCPINHNCWIGVLTCGTPDHESIRNTFFDSVHYEFNFNKFIHPRKHPNKEEHSGNYYMNASYEDSSGIGVGLSPRSLQVHMVVNGDEIVTPDMSYTTLNLKDQLVDVLIGSFTLTIPHKTHAAGSTEREQYRIEARLMWLYLGGLFDFKLPRKPSLAATNKKIVEYLKSNNMNTLADYSIDESWNMLGTVFLGASQYRCPSNRPCPTKNICCGCDAKTMIFNSPIYYDSPMDSAPAESKNVDGSEIDYRDVVGPSIPLPICKNGNHPGRWIRVPDDLAMRCQAAAYILRTKLKTEQQKYDDITAIEDEYLVHAHALNDDFVRFMNEFYKNEREVENNSKVYSVKQSYYDILSRYTNGQNLCSIFFTHGHYIPHMYERQSDRLQIYAPYSCRYVIYNAEESRRCLTSPKAATSTPIHHILFHGDSMSRDLFTVVTSKLQIGHMSDAKLKQMLNAEVNRDTSQGQGSSAQVSSLDGALLATEAYTWNGRDESIAQLAQESPTQVYITNYALAHTIDVSDLIFDEWAITSPAITHWIDLLKDWNDASKIPPIRIFQSSKDMQGMRNPYLDFWTNENFAHHSAVVSHYYIDILGFFDLNEYLLTSGKLDYTDGWHFSGPAKQMESVIVLNIICNNNP